MSNKLYVIPRTDMDSMTVGRIAAQVSHASTKMMYDLQVSDVGNNPQVQDLLEDWLNEANGFGTTIVLRPNTDKNQVEEFTELHNSLNNIPEKNFISGLVIDPEYYIRDGHSVHIVKDVMTCLYIFGDSDEISKYINHYKLL